MEDITQNQRRVSLTIHELTMITAAVGHTKLVSFEELKQKIQAVIDEESDPEFRKIRDAYRDAVTTRDGETEQDGDAEVSLGDDPGAYVMTWTWVPAEDAGVCISCGELFGTAGDGWMGECPDCADISASQERSVVYVQ